MGQRCVTGEKSTKWRLVARALNLPLPTDEDCYEHLSGDDLVAWHNLGMSVEAVANEWREGEAELIKDIELRPLVYAQFMRLVGVMDADRAEWENEFQREHPLPFDCSHEEWEARDAEMAEKYKFIWA